MDDAIQQYVLEIRRHNGPVNTAVVMAGAKGLIKSMDATMLTEFGGPATLSRGWAMSLLKRMKFTKRIGTTQAKIAPDQFEKLKITFLIDVVEMEEIPPRLLSSNWTMERKGTKRVKLCGLKDKRMITGIFCGNLNGEMIPFQLIYGG